MTRSAHTRGPWESDGRFITAADPTGTHPEIYIAEIIEIDDEGRVATPEQQFANAQLIAAVPELLAAAQLVIERWSNGDLAEAVRQLDAAVNTARGED